VGIDLKSKINEETKENSKVDNKKIALLIVGCFLTLFVARIAIINYFDSAITRFGCMNHAVFLNEEALFGRYPVDLSNSQIESLEGETLQWSVRRHIRSNKLGLLNRDSARCDYTTNISGLGEVQIAMSDANPGSFYFFGKLLGIMLQVGLVAGFIRWFHYRFIE